MYTKPNQPQWSMDDEKWDLKVRKCKKMNMKVWKDLDAKENDKSKINKQSKKKNWFQEKKIMVEIVASRKILLERMEKKRSSLIYDEEETLSCKLIS